MTTRRGHVPHHDLRTTSSLLIDRRRSSCLGSGWRLYGHRGPRATCRPSARTRPSPCPLSTARGRRSRRGAMRPRGGGPKSDPWSRGDSRNGHSCSLRSHTLGVPTSRPPAPRAARRRSFSLVMLNYLILHNTLSGNPTRTRTSRSWRTPPYRTVDHMSRAIRRVRRRPCPRSRYRPGES